MERRAFKCFTSNNHLFSSSALNFLPSTRLRSLEKLHLEVNAVSINSHPLHIRVLHITSLCRMIFSLFFVETHTCAERNVDEGSQTHDTFPLARCGEEASGEFSFLASADAGENRLLASDVSGLCIVCVVASTECFASATAVGWFLFSTQSFF